MPTDAEIEEALGTVSPHTTPEVLKIAIASRQAVVNLRLAFGIAAERIADALEAMAHRKRVDV